MVMVERSSAPPRASSGGPGARHARALRRAGARRPRDLHARQGARRAPAGSWRRRREVVDLLRQRAAPTSSPTRSPPRSSARASPRWGSSRVDRAPGPALRETRAASGRGWRRRGSGSRPASTSIVPVMLGDARLATDLAGDLLAEGIYVVGFSFRWCRRGEARIRVQLSAAPPRRRWWTAPSPPSPPSGRRRGVVA